MTSPKPPPNRNENKNWDRNPNHLYVSHVASNLCELLFSFPIKQQKNLLRLATKSVSHLDHTSQITLHCTRAGDPLCSAVQLRQELVQIILISILQLIPKLIQPIKNWLQAFATRFPLGIFTLLVAWTTWKDRCLSRARECIRNKKFPRRKRKKEMPQGVYFSWSRGRCEQIKQLVSVHGLQARVLSINDSIGDWHLEPLERHHLLLKGATHDETVNIHHFPLTQPMCSVHSL